MDAHNHDLLNSIDASRAAQYTEALAAWRSGPFAEWRKAVLASEQSGEALPARPPPPPAPASLRVLVCAAAQNHGVTVDDLVRHARRSEVRTVYPDARLDAARDALDSDVVSALAALDWPALPPLPEPPPPPEPAPAPASAEEGAQ
jgi:hypothetical protein